MGLSRSGTLFLIGLLVLIALSLHPVASVEAVVDAVFVPARGMSELARPFKWFAASRVRAAEAEDRAAFAAERERSQRVLLASQSAAVPSDPALVRGRAFVGAHVIGHASKKHDRLRLCYPVDAGVEPGLPVVYGDVFVGRVIEIDRQRRGECVAELVTSKNFRVGALLEVGGKHARFVVGGVLGNEKKDDHDLRLAAQYPSDRTITSGVVRVSEESASPDARLADGFRLGGLEFVSLRGVSLPGVHAKLDYAYGLNHVAIVCPPQMATAGAVLALDPFDDTSWIGASVLLAGDASALRETRKLALARAEGVRPGAALSIGARFVGRVERVGLFDVDARLLRDPGVAFNAMARIEGTETPFVLGRLISRGSERASGAVLFEWAAAVPLVAHGNAPQRAELWTAAGEPDVPPGLLIGTTTLPCGKGPFTLRVTAAQDVDDVLHMRVWRGRAGATEEGT